MAAGGFSPVATGQKGVVAGAALGPGSNTGQKGGALIDYLTIVIPRDALEDRGLSKIPHLIQTLLGIRDEIVSGAIRNKPWQFYAQSAVLVDREGEMVGRVGLGGNGDTVCVSISGLGCRWVRNWRNVARQCEALRARLSRVDVAFDDYEGTRINVDAMRDRAIAGEFAEGGRPPRHRFLSDEGHDTGSTLYVGGKGHKELCVYEKGRQLGMSESPWTRAEVRLYGKHTTLPYEVLTNPLAYLLGAYGVLREVLRDVWDGACTRLKTFKASAEATGTAWMRWMGRTVGGSFHLLREVFGPEWSAHVEQHLARDRHPARFRGIAKGAALHALLRSELCPASP